VRLASDALANQLPHDRLELLAVAPAPGLLGDGGQTTRVTLALPVFDADASDAIDAMVHTLGAREGRPGLRSCRPRRPRGLSERIAGERKRQRGDAGGAARDGRGNSSGWLWLGSETAEVRPEDEAVARLAAQLPRPAGGGMGKRAAEIAGVWG